MAIITETDVVVTITVIRDELGNVRVKAHGQSVDAGGNVVRTTRNIDITDNLTAQQVTGAGNVLSSAESRLRTIWNIT